MPVSAGATVGVALEVRNVITAENDTNLVRRIPANLMNAFTQLKARHSTSQRTPIVGACVYPLQAALSDSPDRALTFPRSAAAAPGICGGRPSREAVPLL